MRISSETTDYKVSGLIRRTRIGMDKQEPVPKIMPWIDWTARCIPDPVVRLRFLRATAPVWQPEGVTAPNFSRARALGLSCLAMLALSAVGALAGLTVGSSKPYSQ